MTKMKRKISLFPVLWNSLLFYLAALTWFVITKRESLETDFVGVFTFEVVVGLVLTFLIIVCLTWLISRYHHQIGEFVYRYRYLLAGLFIAFAVIFQISGSSIGMWGDYIGGSENDKIILGTSRAIRSDEWATLTSFTFAQAKDSPAFSYINQIIRGGGTDVAMVYAQPIWDIITLFRPAYYGFLLFGMQGGLAFFWAFRQMFMLLAVFELGMVLTNNNKKLSLALSLLLTYAALTQWWFAVNGLLEIFATGSIAVLAIRAYMRTTSYLKRFLLCLALIWLGGVYVLTFYPAWQVPFAYVFLILALYVIFDNSKAFQFNWKKDTPLWLLTIVSFGLLMGLMFYRSLDTILSVLSTVYPGNRTSTGGGEGLTFLFDYPQSLFYSLTGMTWERGMDVFYDFFPFSTLYALFVYVKTKDKLLLALVGLSSFFLIYIVFGFPTLLAKASLMSYTIGVRAIAAFGFVNLLALFRSLSFKVELRLSRLLAIGSLTFIAIMLVLNRDFMLELIDYGLAKVGQTQLLYVIFIGISLLVLARLLYLMLKQKDGKLLTLIIWLSLFTGVMVNPIRVGTAIVDEHPLIQKIEAIASNDKSKIWAVESMSYPRTNLSILAGAATINSTNTYPNFELWQKLDPEGIYESIYNRYAHIEVILVNQVEGERFTLLQPDSFSVQVTPEELTVLGIDYIVSERQLETYSTDSVKITVSDTWENYNIYKVTME